MDSELLSQWMKRAADGDAEAKEIVVLALSEQLPRVLAATSLRFGYRLRGQEVEELTQEMLASVVSANFSYDARKGAFGTWATTVAQRRLVRFFRDRRRQISETDLTSHRNEKPFSLFTPLEARPEGIFAPETPLEATDRMRSRVEEGIKYLSAREAEVLRLTLGGETTYEIAAKIGVSHQTVSNYLTASYEHVRTREAWLQSPEGRERARQIDLLPEPDRSIFIAVKLDGISEVSAGRYFGVLRDAIRASVDRSNQIILRNLSLCHRVSEESAD